MFVWNHRKCYKNGMFFLLLRESKAERMNERTGEHRNIVKMCKCNFCSSPKFGCECLSIACPARLMASLIFCMHESKIKNRTTNMCLREKEREGEKKSPNSNACGSIVVNIVVRGFLFLILFAFAYAHTQTHTGERERIPIFLI